MARKGVLNFLPHNSALQHVCKNQNQRIVVFCFFLLSYGGAILKHIKLFVAKTLKQIITKCKF